MVPCILQWKGARTALMALGWVAIGTIVGARLFRNLAVVPTIVSPGSNFSFRDDFSNGPDPAFWQSGLVSRVVGTCFYPNRWRHNNGLLTLPLEKKPAYCHGRRGDFRGSLIMSRVRVPPPFRVTARLKAAAGPGIISSFFTYSDPTFGTPHFENDFEFPGQGVSRNGVWTTVYNPSVPRRVTGDYSCIPLPFDAARNFAEYTIEVREKSTTWKINGRTIREISQFTPPPAQCIMMNAWFKARWMGLYETTKFDLKHRDYEIDWVEVSSLES